MSPIRTAILVGLAVLAFAPASHADDRLPVVASFSILGDMVERVGGDHVEVTTFVGPDGDAHVYQPTPADAAALADARVLFVNGLAYEGWVDRLVSSSGYRGPIVVATSGITPIAGFGEVEEKAGRDHAEMAAHAPTPGGADPHAWHDLANARLYVDTIASGLGAADPAHAADYATAAGAYKAELAALDGEIRAMLAAVPRERRRILTSHDAFGYFGRAYDIRFIAPIGLSTDAEPSAGDVAAIIDQIRAEGIAALFVENISDPRLVERIAAETGVTVGGALYSDALSAPGTPGATFIGLERANAETIARALTPKS
jgi:zinc/manganese transport system substrate-binding protein